jgi:hypothetical protein
MTAAKLSIAKICADPEAVQMRRSVLQAVLDSVEDAFGKAARIRAKQEEHALNECVHLVAQSIQASLEGDWNEAGRMLNSAYRRNGEEPPIESPIQAGYAPCSVERIRHWHRRVERAFTPERRRPEASVFVCRRLKGNSTIRICCDHFKQKLWVFLRQLIIVNHSAAFLWR